MRLALSALVLTACVACTPATTPLTPVASGYKVIEFTRPVDLKDHGINTYRFATKTQLIADRYGEDGTPRYCGMVQINRDPRVSNLCFGFQAPSTLVINPDTFAKVQRPLPDGSFRVMDVQP